MAEERNKHITITEEEDIRKANNMCLDRIHEREKFPKMKQ